MWLPMLLISFGVAVNPASGASAIQAQEATELERALAGAEADRNWVKAVEIAAILAEQTEAGHLEALFRLARLHALAGHAADAIDCLEKIRGTGLFDVHRIRTDGAFDSIREDGRFQTVSQGIWFDGYLYLLERPERDAYQQPDRVMASLAFREGERVAEIGAGSGYFTRRVARAVGPRGTVLAVDIAPELLSYLEDRAGREGLTNIRFQRVEKDDPQLPAGACDTVLMVDTLHYIPAQERGRYAKKIREGLAPGGRLAIIDFRPKPLEERPWGPPPSQKMTREEVDAAMFEAGLVPVRVHDFLSEQFFVEYAVGALGTR